MMQCETCIWACRARIEDEYARNIEKLNKSVEFSSEIGLVSFYEQFIFNCCVELLLI